MSYVVFSYGACITVSQQFCAVVNFVPGVGKRSLDVDDIPHFHVVKISTWQIVMRKNSSTW